MRLTVAIALLAIFCGGAFPWAAGSTSAPRACCRVNGAHHCSVPVRDSGHSLAAPCPYREHYALVRSAMVVQPQLAELHFIIKPSAAHLPNTQPAKSLYAEPRHERAPPLLHS